jgi:hypothetical protein
MLQLLVGLIARPAVLGCIALGTVAGAQTLRLHSLQAHMAEDRANQAEAQRMAERRARATEARTAKAIEGVSHDARTVAAGLDVDTADARRAGDGLRVHTLNRATCSAPAGSGATGRGDAAGEATAVPADMLSGLIDAAVVLADTADRAHAAGTACQRAYAVVTAQGDDGAER